MITPHIFSNQELDRVIKDALPTDGKAGEKVVVGTVDQNGVQVVASFKNNANGWELQAAARHDWGGQNSAGAKVLLRW